MHEPSPQERIDELRQAELSRALKQAEFLQAVHDGLPAAQLERIKADLDALTEIAQATADRYVRDLKARPG